ncbi:MAG: sufE [Verrucomicrobia bacterium]|nr:sufE [Verrucomicrobiota bacterium]
MTLVEKQRLLAEELALIPDAHERLADVVGRSRRAAPFPEADRRNENRVPGCVSAVWLVGELRDGRCYFRCDADGPLVKGLVAFLCEFFNGATPAEITASNADPLAALGLIRNLSPTRQNGLGSVLTAIRAFAARTTLA